MSQAGLVDIEGSNPQIPTQFVTDDGNAVPIGNVLEILGTAVAAQDIPLRTVGSGNTVVIEVQYASANPTSDPTKAGIASFNSADFSVDANGFVSLSGGSFAGGFNVDASTPPGTDPVVPSGLGIVTVTGGQVAAGTTTNVIQTNSLAANTYTIQIQRSSAQAATTIGSNGVSHFNSAQFSVDANGFVSLVAASQAIDSIAVQTGTSPISPTVAGLVTINGAVVAAGTNPIRTDGTGANTMAVEVQISQAIASTNATNIGLSAFNSANFIVDANGFVSLNGAGAVTTLTGNTGGPISPTGGNFNILTDNTTVQFAGAGSTLTQDFGLSNLLLGSSGSSITSGGVNVSLGFSSFTAVTSGSANTVIGALSGNLISSGNSNVIVGTGSGAAITSSSSNTLVGDSCGNSISTSLGFNTVIGQGSLGSLTTGTNNTTLGFGSANAYTSSESSNIIVSNNGVVGESNTIRIGTQGSGVNEQDRCFIAGITGNTVSNTQSVTIDSSTGQLGVQSAESSKTTTFNSSGSWTIDPRTTNVEFFVWGGGGGGGSGRCGATGSSGGGAGGGAGTLISIKALAADLTASPYTVTVGTGGAGGTSINATTTNGNPGSPGNPSSVGSVVLANGGTGGAAGNTGASAAGTSFVYSFGLGSPSFGQGGGGSNALGAVSVSLVYGFGTGGAGGSGYAVGIPRPGVAAGSINNGAATPIVAGGLAGSNLGANAGNGNSPTGLAVMIGGTGGGSGGNDGNVTAGSGGNGAQPGGGGGGGAGNLSLNPSGAGGNGGDGKIVIIEYF